MARPRASSTKTVRTAGSLRLLPKKEESGAVWFPLFLCCASTKNGISSAVFNGCIADEFLCVGLWEVMQLLGECIGDLASILNFSADQKGACLHKPDRYVSNCLNACAIGSVPLPPKVYSPRMKAPAVFEALCANTGPSRLPVLKRLQPNHRPRGSENQKPPHSK
jgi:hypothetical protein